MVPFQSLASLQRFLTPTVSPPAMSASSRHVPSPDSSTTPTSHTRQHIQRQLMSPPATNSKATMRTLNKILPRTASHWVGDGFHVHPIFDRMAFTKEVSPFLMFDYAAPQDFRPTLQRRGVGLHPHRGFETVTIAFQGEVRRASGIKPAFSHGRCSRRATASAYNL